MRLDPVLDAFYIMSSLWSNLPPQVCPARSTAAAGILRTKPIDQPVTAFVAVNVIPMDTERVLPNHTVLIEGGRITALGPKHQVMVPAGAIRIEGQGEYLIPGLADMHVHWGQNDSVALERELFLYVANGVTTIRLMEYSGPNEIGLRARAWAAAGRILSPRLYVSGGWAGDADELKVPLDSVSAYVTAYKAKGYDFIKPYNEPALLYDSLHAAARRIGMPLMGHVPLTLVSLSQALAWRQRSIEHLTGYLDALLIGPRPPWISDQDPAIRLHPDTLAARRRMLDFTRIPALAAATARAGVWNTPTSLLYEMGSLEFRTDTIDWEPELEFYPPAKHADVLARLRSKRPGSAGASLETLLLAKASGVIEARQQLTKALYDAGAGLLLGSDNLTFRWMQMPVIPGLIAHRELQALVRSGLTPYQALTTGTRNVAQFLRTMDSTGTIAVGKRADLVLLSGNPLTDIHHTMRPAGVMIGGRWLPRDEIQRRVAAMWAATPTPHWMP